MLLLQTLLLALSLSDTVVESAKSPRLTVRGSKPRTESADFSLAARPREAELISRVEGCPPGTRYVIGIAGKPGVCLGIYAYATCSIILIGASAYFTTIAVTTATWVKEQKHSESAASPPTKKRDEDGFQTWGELYNYTKSVGRNRLEGKEAAAYVNEVSPSILAESTTAKFSGLDPTSEKAIAAAVEPSESTQFITTNLELHEDGFSASFAPPASENLQQRLSKCNQQVHLHYWADAGHESTILSAGDIQDLVDRTLHHSYNEDYAKACYEMINNGNWQGILRICYNSNLPQNNCYTCFGHSG